MTNLRSSLFRGVAIALLLVLCFLSTSCTDDSLTKTAQAIHDVQLSVSAIQQTTIAASDSGAISASDAVPIVQLTVRINQAVLAANNITRGLSKLDPSARTNLHSILQPILTEVQTSVRSGLVGIKNEQLRTKILDSLATIQTSLTVVMAVIG